MKKVKWIIGLLVLLAATLVVAVLCRPGEQAASGPEALPTQTQGQQAAEQTDPAAILATLPDDMPTKVEIPVKQDADNDGMMRIPFPYRIREYDLVIEKLAPYSGMFLEDGTNREVENVAMLLVYNDAVLPITYTKITIVYGQETLEFDVSALPAGEALVVQEKNGKAIPAGDMVSAEATVVRQVDMQMSEEQVKVTDNGDNTLTIENLTEQNIPTVRIFYKYYMEQEGLFIGGIAFTVRITDLQAGAKVTVQPSHYTSQSCRVVMVLTYDTEV